MQLITDKDKEKPEKNKDPTGFNVGTVETEPEETNVIANLERVLFKKLDIPDEEEEEDEVDMDDKSNSDKESNMGGEEDSQMEGEDKS